MIWFVMAEIGLAVVTVLWAIEKATDAIIAAIRGAHD